MKKKIYWAAFSPIVLVTIMWYLSTMLELISAPNDVGVLIGLIMACLLVLAILFIINIIINTIKNKTKK